MSQISMFEETPRLALVRQLEACEIRNRDGWHEIVYAPTGEIVPGARVDFHHPVLRKNAPYQPRRFRSKKEAAESLSGLKRDVASGLVIVGTS